MNHSKEYFSIQLEFAKKVSELAGISLSDAILNYTTCYKKFEIEGWDFNPNHPVWSDFSKQLESSSDPLSTVYDFYLERQKTQTKDAPSPFGCFSYEYDSEEKHIQIHFKQKDKSGISPLSSERIEVRKDELRRMFSEIRTKYPEAKTVGGFSWLYNIGAYRRLFPSLYTESAKVNQTWFKSYALWGQFVNSKKELKQDMSRSFLSCVESKNTVEELRKCFPYLVLEPEVNIDAFYNFYNIK